MPEDIEAVPGNWGSRNWTSWIWGHLGQDKFGKDGGRVAAFENHEVGVCMSLGSEEKMSGASARRMEKTAQKWQEGAGRLHTLSCGPGTSLDRAAGEGSLQDRTRFEWKCINSTGTHFHLSFLLQLMKRKLWWHELKPTLPEFSPAYCKSITSKRSQTISNSNSHSSLLHIHTKHLSHACHISPS